MIAGRVPSLTPVVLSFTFFKKPNRFCSLSIFRVLNVEPPLPGAAMVFIRVEWAFLVFLPDLCRLYGCGAWPLCLLHGELPPVGRGNLCKLFRGFSGACRFSFLVCTSHWLHLPCDEGSPHRGFFHEPLLLPP